MFLVSLLYQLLGALGDLRIKFQLRHGQLEQMQEPKNTKGWRNHKNCCHSTKDFNEVIENVCKPDGNIKKKQGIRFNKAKIAVLLSWDKRMDWIWLTPSSHVRPYPPPLMRPLSHSHLKVPIVNRWSILKHPNVRLVIFFQRLRLRILKLQTCIVGPNGLLAGGSSWWYHWNEIQPASSIAPLAMQPKRCWVARFSSSWHVYIVRVGEMS